jgi:hypothetical protein
MRVFNVGRGSYSSGQHIVAVRNQSEAAMDFGLKLLLRIMGKGLYQEILLCRTMEFMEVLAPSTWAMREKVYLIGGSGSPTKPAWGSRMFAREACRAHMMEE